uniref:Uncharacterized protein n=1 Tax=Siphoviridae sp. cttdo1 TaxID=2823606 RepID=A0A8S5LC88_9CAUD|nr:MAG TPA: hypothetical protein [Siphoviridae sp. cttdo1]
MIPMGTKNAQFRGLDNKPFVRSGLKLKTSQPLVLAVQRWG